MLHFPAHLQEFLLFPGIAWVFSQSRICSRSPLKSGRQKWCCGISKKKARWLPPCSDHPHLECRVPVQEAAWLWGGGGPCARLLLSAPTLWVCLVQRCDLGWKRLQMALTSWPSSSLCCEVRNARADKSPLVRLVKFWATELVIMVKQLSPYGTKLRGAFAVCIIGFLERFFTVHFFAPSLIFFYHTHYTLLYLQVHVKQGQLWGCVTRNKGLQLLQDVLKKINTISKPS